MERDELRERIARALYEDAHRHQEPEHFYPWERVQSTIVAKGYHRQADAVLAALSGVPATTCTECGGTGGGPVRVSGDEWELQECGVCGGMGYVPAPTERRIIGEATYADGSVEPLLSGDFPRGPSASAVFVDEVPAPTVEYRKVGGGFRFVGPDDPLHEKHVLGIVMMDGWESESDVLVFREVKREPAPTEPAEPWWKKAAREADLRELPPLCHPGGGAPTEPPGPITLRYDVEIRTADGALLAGWLDLPTGAHDQEQADEIRRNIFRLDWSDARIEDIRHRPVPTAPVTDPRASTGRIEPMQNPYVPAPTEGGE